MTFEEANQNSEYWRIIYKATSSFGICDSDTQKNIGVHAIWKAIKGFKPEINSNFCARLYNAAIWECYREIEFRKKSVRNNLIGVDRPDQRYNYDDLTESVNALPTHYRDLIVYKYYDNMSIREISNITKLSSGKVCRDLKTAIGKLRKSFT